MARKTTKQTTEIVPANAGANAVSNPEPETASLFSGLPEELLATLTPAKTRAIMLYLTGQYTQGKIASIVGVTPTTFRAWMLEPAVQAVIKEIQSREYAVIESDLKALQNKAVKTMEELLDSCMDNVRFSAAKDLLDRSGHKPQQSIKVDKTVTSVQQQLAALADFTIDDEEIIDVDVEEVT